MNINSPKIRILIVEDESIIARDIKNAVLALGYEVLGPVSSGEEAVHIGRESKPDLILMDIELSRNMNGIEVAAILRREANIPALFVTSASSLERISQAQTAEPVGYVLKPLNLRDFRVALEMALYRSKLERQLVKAKLEAEEGRILAEEEVQAKNIFLANMGRELKPPLHHMTERIEELLKSNISEPQTALVRELKTASHNLLALATAILDFTTAEKTGMVKPIETPFLDAPPPTDQKAKRRSLQKLLSRNEVAELTAPELPGEDTFFLAPLTTTPEVATLLDLAYIRENFSDQTDLWLELLHHFLTNFPARVQELKTALEARDPVLALRVAHRIKGAAANMGIIGISQPAGVIEKSSRNDTLKTALDEFADMEKRLPTIFELISQILATIKPTKAGSLQ